MTYPARALSSLLIALAACAQPAAPQTSAPSERLESSDTGTHPTAFFRVIPESVANPELTVTIEEPAADVVPDYAVEIEAPFSTKTQSVRVLAQMTVFAEPRRGSAALGELASGSRLGWTHVVKAPGCKWNWIAIDPKGWICAEVQASKRQATDVVLPRLAKGARIPGVFGKIKEGATIYPTRAAARAGVDGRKPDRSLTLQRLDVFSARGTKFWRTRHGYIATTDLKAYKGSPFKGVWLDREDSPSLPMAWTLRDYRSKRSTIPVFSEPSFGATVTRRIKPRRVVSIGETSTDGKFASIGQDEWIATADLKIARAAEPPAGTRDDERWLDIDLSSQTLVAYIGRTPVYATMISSGRPNHHTPTGVFRLSAKYATRTMNSMADSDETYSVESVPWTTYFAKGYALHAAYWHGGFGRPKSHGCVNLSPRDAKELYAWSAPLVAPGWSVVYGNETQPGSLIRIRSRRNPSPEFKGYAQALRDAEQMLAQR